jgi:hypothetical protein
MPSVDPRSLTAIGLGFGLWFGYCDGLGVWFGLIIGLVGLWFGYCDGMGFGLWFGLVIVCWTIV